MTSVRARLCFGRVVHRRLRPAPHAFVHPVFYVQLPLTQLTALGLPLFAVDRPALMSFRQRDHGPRDGSPLLPWIRGMLAEHGLPADGEVVLQAFPRVLGYVFNPVSFWFCHDGAGQLVAVLAEVNNTFGDHHAYLLHNEGGAPLRDGQALHAGKAFHVSPFCRVEGRYRFRFVLGGSRPRVHIDYDDAEGELLRTSISGRAVGWSARALLAALLRMPLLTLGVTLRIHWQALRLWLKGVPFHGRRPPPHRPPTSANP